MIYQKELNGVELPRLLHQILRCPLHPDSEALKIPQNCENLRQQVLVCPICQKEFPVIDGIPDMVLSQEHDDNFRQKEMQQWDEQAPRYEEKRITDPIYMAGIDAVVNNIGPDPKAFILDAACGTGLTIKKYYRPGMRIVALDLSLESLKTLRRTFPCESIYLVKGGLTCLPFPSDTFNRVICANAITQVPKSDLREKCFYELARVGRLHAKIVVSGHNYSQPKKRAGWPKEGIARSSSGNVQYIYRFDRDEFRFLLGKTSQIQCIRGAGLPLLYKWKLSWLSRRLERLLRLFSFSTSWGNMIVGTGLKI